MKSRLMNRHGRNWVFYVRVFTCLNWYQRENVAYSEELSEQTHDDLMIHVHRDCPLKKKGALTLKMV